MAFDDNGRSAGAFQTSIYVVLVISFGTVLHPELKAFYRRGHGDMKNTVSAIDAALATFSLAALRLLCSSCASDGPRPNIPFWQKLRWAAPPGIFVFLVITLSTWANFLSYKALAMLGPCELIFVWIFARFLQEERQVPLCRDLPAVILTALGSVLFSIAEVARAGPTSTSASAWAIVASLLCRACQALMTVSLRSCCVNVGRVGVLEITLLKLLVTSLLCLPYALLTEGLEPWWILADKEFWADSTSAFLLLGSIFITTGFQWATVGTNAGLRSPLVAVLLGTLQPLTAVALVLAFSNSPFCQALGLKRRDSPLEIAGICCLILGLLLGGLCSLRQLRVTSDLRDQTLEFLDHRAAAGVSAGREH
ncbi:unnamed protein product [Symbiodinium necroappetens]|uniref:EamA domain-containing protein n=1 Tax=Symbiodinium necroappetens TaxID=1628268 RepID=A0A813A9W2_9DINO|nr:unnamed protein product [Symbiodinium necroappetens]